MIHQAERVTFDIRCRVRQQAQLVRSGEEANAAILYAAIVESDPGRNQFGRIERPVRHVLMLRYKRAHARRFSEQLAAIEAQGMSQDLS